MPTRHTPPLPKRLNGTEEAILKTVSTLRYALLDEIVYGHFSKSSRNYAREVVTRLSGGGDWQDGYLLRFPLPTTRGNAPRIFCPSRRGASYLKKIGLPGRWYCRVDKVRNAGTGYLLHHLTVARILMRLQCFVRANPAYQLAEQLTGYDIAQDPPRVTMRVDGHEATVSVIPDAWVYLELADDQCIALWLEIDACSEFKRKWQQLCLARISLIRSGQYEAYFGTPAVLLLYLVTSPTPAERDTRLHTLRRWTYELLETQKLTDWTAVFRFVAVAFGDIYTTPLFDAPVWYLPDSSHAQVPLLDPLTGTRRSPAVPDGQEHIHDDDSQTATS